MKSFYAKPEVKGVDIFILVVVDEVSQKDPKL